MTQDLADARAELCALLQKALMLELSTIPPYATALYSILQEGQYNRSDPELVNAEPIEVIRQVMVEEMLHMVLVANVLNSIGGTPQMTNPSLLPTYPYDLLGGRGPTVYLRRFTPEQVKRFRQIETAPESPDPGRRGDYHTIGGFYIFIKTRLKDICDSFGVEEIFIGEEDRQITNDDYYGAGGQVIEVAGSAQERYDAAIEAIDEIMEEGEGACLGHRAGDKDPIPGPEGHEDVAHFFKFNEILHSRYYHPDDPVEGPPTGKDLIVDWRAVAPMRDNPARDHIVGHPDIEAMSQAFNVTWSKLLLGLERAFNGERAALRQLVPVMYELKSNAIRLMRTPLPDGSGETAGPTWTFLSEGCEM
ncbi:ferritin-like protein [Shimia sp. R10_1]|uniref:ferritin-like domain-containing protein n=1 Tax=Shimia sp. R10_1 TaxID=2821095 RepID=UPI001ADAEBB5|nr:ferritin-like protein [Shimia sp. R10_1]MBO9474103.1 ferritin-like protein [Shimia sp. R10_1]